MQNINLHTYFQRPRRGLWKTVRSAFGENEEPVFITYTTMSEEPKDISDHMRQHLDPFLAEIQEVADREHAEFRESHLPTQLLDADSQVLATGWLPREASPGSPSRFVPSSTTTPETVKQRATHARMQTGDDAHSPARRTCKILSVEVRDCAECGVEYLLTLEQRLPRNRKAEQDAAHQQEGPL